MSYVRVWQDGWKNHDTGGTPIDAESLNHMEDGIAENDAAITEIQREIRDLTENDTSVLAQAKRYSDERISRMKEYTDTKDNQIQIITDQSLQNIRNALTNKIDGAYIENGYLYFMSGSSVLAGPYGPFASADTMNALNDTISSALLKFTDNLEVTEEGLVYLLNGSRRIAGPYGPFAESGGGNTDELEKTLRELQLSVSDMASRYANALEITNSGLLYLLNDGNRIAGPYGPFSGGGGSSTGNVSYNVTNETGWISSVITSGAPCNVSINWYSSENNLATGDGILQISVGASQSSLAVKATMSVMQGTVTLDLAPYLSDGTNSVRVSVTDVYGNSRYVVFSVEVVTLTLTSSFIPEIYTGSFSFPYTPLGSGAKSVHFLIDGEETGTASTSYSNRQLTYTVPRQAHGAHILECYFTVTLNGQTVSSNTLRYAFISVIEGDNTPVIASDFAESSVIQYSTVRIGYMVYTPGSLTSDVTIFANGEPEAVLSNVSRTAQTFAYRANITGALNIMISTGNVSRSWSVTVEPSGIEVEAETDSLELYFTSAKRSNQESSPGSWVSGEIVASLVGFNFRSDGWIHDGNGNTALRVSGEARVTIPYNLFAGDIRSTGKTIELEFAARSVRDYDAVLLSCLDSDGRGISITAQKAALRSEGCEIYTQYKEEELVRIAFVIEKRSENRLVYIYINGIMSGAVQYPETDRFSGASVISIGSRACTLDLYTLRVYNNNLNREQILNNWIADTQDGAVLVERYNRNHVLDEYGRIVINQLPSDLPYMVITCPELPQYKGDKKTCKITYVDPANPSRNFVADRAQSNVQGTSSQGYPRKNYKISFKNGVTLANGTKSTVWPLTDGAIATDSFCLKADYASSEGANNVELVRLYNDTCVYQTPPQQKDSRVRQGIDGFPIVVFWQQTDTNGNAVGSASFIGKYNFNNDKGTPEVFGFADGDESWEVKNNTSLRSLFKSADFTSTVTDAQTGKTSPAWMEDFEARYPEDNEDATNLHSFVAWIMSTDQDAVSGTEEKTARLQKFRNELHLTASVNALIFYYLFTELFLMVDSRAKNAFWTEFWEDGDWFSLPYDFDTALGINNEGALVFGYHLEDTDKTDSGADVFNGQNSVLWVNLRQAFYSEIATMYNTLRSSGAWSYKKVEAMFEEHQSKWPEAVFNEDSYFKYIAPLADGVNHLDMLQGAKTEQRRWWLYNRFRYMDSKYNAGDALRDFISLRGYARADITLTPYADIYTSVKYGQTLVQKRALRGASQTLECPLDNVNDTEIYIYSASQLADTGDLSGLKVGQADFSAAVKLQRLKLGDESASYENGNLSVLTLGNNTLLKTLDVRNCTGLTGTVDLSGCMNIEEVYFDGTNTAGVVLPDGGILKTLHLPASITNLTIRNQLKLEDVVLVSCDNITTLWLENVSDAIDPVKLLGQIRAGSRVRLIGFHMDAENVEAVSELYALFDQMTGLDETGLEVSKAQVSGSIHVTGIITGEQIAAYAARYPYITVRADTVISKLYYYNWDGSELLYTQTIQSMTYRDGAYDGDTPYQANTEKNKFTFIGWSLTAKSVTVDIDALKSVWADRTVYAAFSISGPTYTVRFYNGSLLLWSVSNVVYGETVEYIGAAPTSGVYVYDGWSPAPTNVMSDLDCYASFNRKTLADSWEEILANIDNLTYSQRYHIGDSKILDLGAEGAIRMQLAAMEADELADGSGNAKTTWIAYHILNTPHVMNDTLPPNENAESMDGTVYAGKGSIGGWDQSKMRTYLRDSILPMVPEPVRSALKTVKKYSATYTATNPIVFDRNFETKDKLWILSAREIFGNVSSLHLSSNEDSKIEQVGVTYSDFFEKTGIKRRVYRSDDTDYEVDWWFRSATSTSTWYFLEYYNGTPYGYYANESYSVVIGFSL